MTREAALAVIRATTEEALGIAASERLHESSAVRFIPLAHMLLIARRLEDAFGVVLDDVEVCMAATLGDVVDLVLAQRARASAGATEDEDPEA